MQKSHAHFSILAQTLLHEETARQNPNTSNLQTPTLYSAKGGRSGPPYLLAPRRWTGLLELRIFESSETIINLCGAFIWT
jgi:hypothetical protein